MTESITVEQAGEALVLTDDQQTSYDEVMAWLTERDPSVKQPDGIDLRYRRPKFALPAGAEAWFKDNQDDYFVLKGFAGTGKSTLTSKLIKDLSAQDWNMAVCAPTNKAVGVIQEKVRDAMGDSVLAATFCSLHSVCGIRMIETDDGHHIASDSGLSNLNQYDLVIIDEASMVDTAMLLRSVQSGRGSCLVLFVGDPAQLPPVIEKSVAKLFRLPRGSMLSEITRVAAGNPLIAAAMHVRKKNRCDELLSEGADEIFAGMGPDDRVKPSDLMEWLPDSMVRGSSALAQIGIDLQREGHDARVIAYRNSTVLRNNENAHFALHPSSGYTLFSVGERVIVQSACKAESLDTGKTVDLVTSEELVVEYVELTKHPLYPTINVYQLALRDYLGNSVVVYVPKLMTAFKHHCAKLFDEVRDLSQQLKRRYSIQVSDQLRRARGEAWGFKNSFAEIRHTYSITAHKSQGSTFDIVLIDLLDLMTMQSAFEFNCALYVALTRARLRAYISY